VSRKISKATCAKNIFKDTSGIFVTTRSNKLFPKQQASKKFEETRDKRQKHFPSDTLVYENLFSKRRAPKNI